MPLFASNFTSNSLSGTVRVSGGAANISFGIAPFALEGNKTFVVKLRRGSVVGDVIATSDPITINDFSEVISLTANISTVAEGNIVSVALVTANVPNNANIFYSIFPVTANVTASDFYGANAGIVTVNNNQATVSFYANTDAGYVNEDGETFKVQLRTNGTSGSIVYTSANIVVTDFYKLYNAIAFTESSAAVVEGGALTFTFTGHNIPLGKIIYYSTEGNVTSGSFTTGNTGSFVMNSVSNTINFTTTTTVFSGETRNFNLKLRTDSETGPLLATSNAIAILDGGGSVIFNNLTTTSSTFAQGSNIIFTANITNGNGYTYYYKTVGNVTTSDFAGGNTGTFTANTTGAIITLRHTASIPTNEERTFTLQITEDTLTGAIKATSNNITVFGPTPYILAFGGTEIIDAASNTKLHIFTGSNTFTVSKLSSESPARNSITFLSVAGGGGGGGGAAGYWGGMGGAGAGGWIDGTYVANVASSNIVVGAGGVGDVHISAYDWVRGTKGSDTVMGIPGVGPAGSKTSFGGGSASHEYGTSEANGGSGGTGPGERWYSNPYAGTGYGYPSPTQQGSPGAPGTPGGVYAGGGGGAATAGSSYVGGTGKPFAAPTEYGTPGPAPGRYFAGGGGGGGGGPAIPNAQKVGGAGGGGPAGLNNAPSPTPGMAGNVNTGGGGGGLTFPGDTGATGNGGNGGSGIVIIKYPYVQ